MSRCKVALVDLDGKPVPAWVPPALRDENMDLVIHDCKTRAELANYAADADLVWLFGGSRILFDGNLDAVPNCWAIVRTGSGTDNIPVEEATRRGIVVANTPQAFSDAVSDHAIALMFAAARQVAALDRAVRRGDWSETEIRPICSIHGATLGLIGFGHVARKLIRKLKGFAMQVVAYDPFVTAETMASFGARAVPLDALLAAADFVSLHCPLTSETQHLIGERELRLMKPTAVLVNTSRGAVIDERAMLRALDENWIGAAALDVVESEPLVADSPLLQPDNIVVTPHLAGYSPHGVAIRWRHSVDALIALARQQWPASCVNPSVLPRRPLSREPNINTEEF